MSEHQIYEFLSLDNPLSRAQQAELRAISSRAQITSTRFYNEYEWGDLKAKPKELLSTYFDAFLYLANWGSRWLMFKLPLHLIDMNAIDAYCDGELIWLKKVGKAHAILSIQSRERDDEDVEDYWRHMQTLSELLPIREQLIQRDYRALFLLHLHARANPSSPDGDDMFTQRAVLIPPDLDRHDSALERLTALFALDEDLISAAASVAPKPSRPARKEPTTKDHQDFLKTLSAKTKDDILLEAMSAHANHARHKLLALFHEHTSSTNEAGDALLTPERFDEILSISGSIKRERQQKTQQERARQLAGKQRKEKEALEARITLLTQNWETTWHTIDAQIQSSQRKGYQTAAVLIQTLLHADLTPEQMNHTLTRLAHYRTTYSKRSALLEELDKLNLP